MDMQLGLAAGVNKYTSFLMHVLGQVEAVYEKSISVFQELCGEVVSGQSLLGGAAGAV